MSADPKQLSTDFSSENVALAAAARLNEFREETIAQIGAIERLAGVETLLALIAEAEAIEHNVGMMTADGSRRRTVGGIFFKLAELKGYYRLKKTEAQKNSTAKHVAISKKVLASISKQTNKDVKSHKRVRDERTISRKTKAKIRARRAKAFERSELQLRSMIVRRREPIIDSITSPSTTERGQNSPCSSTSYSVDTPEFDHEHFGRM